MPDVLRTSRREQSVLILRLRGSARSYGNLIDMMQQHGIVALPCHNVEHVRRAVQRGCVVGILLLANEAELALLCECETLLAQSGVTWVGLVDRIVVNHPAVRQLTADFLFNYLVMPAPIENVALIVRQACGMASVRRHRSELIEKNVGLGMPPTMVGRSPDMQRLFEQIKRVARTDAAVLICGKSGTGKELAAQSIHRQSARCAAPFVAVNSGAIPAALFQSELFGYEKGAFTGAAQRRIGRIEAARGGTLFLDEIGDIPLEMQVNLLRFLQEKTIERVGGNATLRIDVRVIAATHVDHASAVAHGRFREDLYYRINVVCVVTPRLAERTQDIEELARHYFTHFAACHNKSLRGFSKAALQAMLCHEWPGNVRELVNRVQRAVVMAEGRFIQPEDLGLDGPTESAQMSLEAARAASDLAVIQRALAQARNQISQAAELLGVSRVPLYRLLAKYQLRPVSAAAPARQVEKPLTLVAQPGANG